MPIGMKNVPVTFKRTMDIVLAPVKQQHALVYIKNVVIFSKTAEKHLNHVEFVLQLISKAEMTPNLNTCFSFPDAIKCLGHVIMSEQLQIASKTIDSVHVLRYPTTTFKLPSFLRLCSVYCRLVLNFSRMAASLNKQLKKGKPTTFELNDEE